MKLGYDEFAKLMYFDALDKKCNVRYLESDSVSCTDDYFEDIDELDR